MTYVISDLHGRWDKYREMDDYGLDELLFGRPNPDTEYFNDKYLVFGHTPTRLLFRQDGEPPRDEIYEQGKLIGIDCGCAFSSRLGCLCLDTMERYYI